MGASWQGEDAMVDLKYLVFAALKASAQERDETHQTAFVVQSKVKFEELKAAGSRMSAKARHAQASVPMTATDRRVKTLLTLSLVCLPSGGILGGDVEIDAVRGPAGVPGSRH